MKKLFVVVFIFISFLILSCCNFKKNLSSDEIKKLFENVEISFENDFTFKYDYTDTLNSRDKITEFFQYNKEENVLYIYNKRYAYNYRNFEDLPILEGYIYIQSYNKEDLILLNSISKTGQVYLKSSISTLYFNLIEHDKFTMIKYYSKFLQIKKSILNANLSSNVVAYKMDNKIYLSVNNSTIEYIISSNKNTISLQRIIHKEEYVSTEVFYISRLNNNLQPIDIKEFIIC